MKKNRIWTNDELEFVKKNANTMSCYDIGLKIGRSEQSVSHKLSRLGINKKTKYSKVKNYTPKQTTTKGFNDHLYIGNQFGEWIVVKRIETTKRQPFYLCINHKEEQRIFRQDNLKKMLKKQNISIDLPKEEIFETKYANIFVSKRGNVYRKWTLISGHTYFRKYSLCDMGGYLCICAGIDGEKTTLRVHRLIAETFIPNPNNYPIINHKDENKQNNNVDNLEWCDVQYNNTYGARIEKAKKTYYENRMRKQRQMVAN